jgi:hypothetical protein
LRVGAQDGAAKNLCFHFAKSQAYLCSPLFVHLLPKEKTVRHCKKMLEFSSSADHADVADLGKRQEHGKTRSDFATKGGSKGFHE